jgi:hypothetical protein
VSPLDAGSLPVNAASADGITDISITDSTVILRIPAVILAVLPISLTICTDIMPLSEQIYKCILMYPLNEWIKTIIYI